MYYPILRGRQNELLAIKELLNASVLSDKIIPIIEPVKLSPTLVNTLTAFTEANRDLILIRNPKVGSFNVDAKNSKNAQYKEKFHTKAKMLSYDEVEALIGHAVGGVCPFGINEGVTVYLDESLKRFETVFPAAGSSNSAIELTIPELEKYSNFVEWVNVCKDWE